MKTLTEASEYVLSDTQVNSLNYASTTAQFLFDLHSGPKQCFNRVY